MDTFDDFEDDNTLNEQVSSTFVVDIDGFEGPIDVLLTLARDQKVDISQISIVQLADQYLEFVSLSRRRNLEIAADYLVMAAWLAYLKSRLLLPDLDAEGEPTGEEMAKALAFQLKRLEAVQDAGIRLMGRNQLGKDFFSRGMPEHFKLSRATVFDVTLYDLLRAYSSARNHEGDGTLRIKPWELFNVDDALGRLNQVIGKIPDWQTLVNFLPDNLKNGLPYRSAVASTLVASLEMVREGKLKIRQDDFFGPIFLRSSKDDLTDSRQRSSGSVASTVSIEDND